MRYLKHLKSMFVKVNSSIFLHIQKAVTIIGYPCLGSHCIGAIQMSLKKEQNMIDELIKELRSYPAHYVAAHRAADALERIDFYNCRLEDDLFATDLETERLRKHIAKQQLDIITLGQEVGRLREALRHCANSIAEWERKPEGIAPFLLGALDNARAALGEGEK